MIPNSTDPVGGGDSRPAPLSLRIVRGLHAGARRDGDQAMVSMIGSADDCDMILADHGIAPRHAIVSVGARGWSVRALDGVVRHGSRSVGPGESFDLHWFDIAEIGPAALSVGEADSARWQSLREFVPDPTIAVVPLRSHSRRRRYGLVAAIGLPILAATAFTAASLYPDATPLPPSPRTVLEQSVEDVALERSEIVQEPNGKLRVSGLADDASRVHRLRGDLAARGVVADVDVRSGDNIAIDVAEVLRLSDLDVRTEYRGQGEVGITGHFGDGMRLDEVLASRAIRDIKGLAKVAVVNLDGAAPAPVPVSTDAQARHIVVAVGGKDPYVVTGDGSRYFAGARMPCGGRLQAVDGQRVYFESDGGTSIGECTGAVLVARVNAEHNAGPVRPVSEHDLSVARSPNG